MNILDHMSYKKSPSWYSDIIEKYFADHRHHEKMQNLTIHLDTMNPDVERIKGSELLCLTEIQQNAFFKTPSMHFYIERIEQRAKDDVELFDIFTNCMEKMTQELQAQL